MSYEQFIEEIETRIQRKVGDNQKIYIHTAVKNNGICRKGITFVEAGVNVSPTIYLEEYFERFQMGSDVDGITEQILELYKSVRVANSWEDRIVREYDKIKGNIFYRLVNRNANKKLLEEIPYIPYLDLAITFYALIELDVENERMATMQVKNEHLQWWGISKDELYNMAKYNTEKLLPYEFVNLMLVVEEIMEDDVYHDADEVECDMYVLTNTMRSFGAAAILYPERLKSIGMYFKENYYVLPSSVHEVIIVPESRALTREQLNAMIQEINALEVPEEEILSNYAYYYDIKKERLLL